MYDPFAPPQLPQQGQMQTTAVPQTVGMVPGVPGSMGLNPNGPVMTPGGGVTGAPVMAGGPSPNNALGSIMQSPQFQALLQAFPQISHYLPQGGQMGQGTPSGRADWRSAMTDWRGQRPDRQTYSGNDWRGTIQDWRQQRPDFFGGFGQHPAPVGGANGNTGIVPPDLLPPQPMLSEPAPTVGSGVPAPNGRRFPRGGAGNGYGF